VYELPRAAPLLTGPGPARVTELGHEQIAGRAGTPGWYELRLRWSPYWHVVSGDACIRTGRGKDAIDLWIRSPGSFRLAISDHVGEVVKSAMHPTRCT
jgi:hypothetical protein